MSGELAVQPSAQAFKGMGVVLLNRQLSGQLPVDGLNQLEERGG